jgi:hypothetical protein
VHGPGGEKRNCFQLAGFRNETDDERDSGVPFAYSHDHRRSGALHDPVQPDGSARAAHPGLVVVMKKETLVAVLELKNLLGLVDGDDLAVERMHSGIGSFLG